MAIAVGEKDLLLPVLEGVIVYSAHMGQIFELLFNANREGIALCSLTVAWTVHSSSQLAPML